MSNWIKAAAAIFMGGCHLTLSSLDLIETHVAGRLWLEEAAPLLGLTSSQWSLLGAAIVLAALQVVRITSPAGAACACIQVTALALKGMGLVFALTVPQMLLVSAFSAAILAAGIHLAIELWDLRRPRS